MFKQHCVSQLPAGRKKVKHKMDHLVCFVPAMLALGSHMGAVTGAKAESYMQLAVNLTETCWQFYHTQPTGRCAHFSLHAQYGSVGAHCISHTEDVYMLTCGLLHMTIWCTAQLKSLQCTCMSGWCVPLAPVCQSIL